MPSKIWMTVPDAAAAAGCALGAVFPIAQNAVSPRPPIERQESACRFQPGPLVALLRFVVLHVTRMQIPPSA